jgi:phospholipid/cholesterol/gamma-HCH transport system substrate-binding protein
LAKQTSIEIKVGLFVLICLAAIAGLVIKFGKLERFSEKTYDVTVVFPNVGGIVRDANVIYAGIPVGKVHEIKLTEDGTLKVRVTLAIYQDYTIHNDAKFVINQSGLLGDRYVDVIPQSMSTPALKSGDVVEGMSSVDLTEAIRGVVDVLHQAAGTIARVDEMVRRTDQAIKRIDELVLNTQSLDHVSSTLANIDSTTSNAVTLTASLRSVIDDSRSSVSNTLGQFSLAADDVRDASKRVRALVQNNEDELSATASNLATSTARLNAILEGVQKGEGTAGKLLTDPTLHDELVKLVQNWRKYGILYKDKSARPATESTATGKPVVPARPAN